jgi:hypothetical protein
LNDFKKGIEDQRTLFKLFKWKSLTHYNLLRTSLERINIISVIQSLCGVCLRHVKLVDREFKLRVNQSPECPDYIIADNPRVRLIIYHMV